MAGVDDQHPPASVGGMNHPTSNADSGRPRLHLRSYSYDEEENQGFQHNNPEQDQPLLVSRKPSFQASGARAGAAGGGGVAAVLLSPVFFIMVAAVCGAGFLTWIIAAGAKGVFNPGQNKGSSGFLATQEPSVVELQQQMMDGLSALADDPVDPAQQQRVPVKCKHLPLANLPAHDVETALGRVCKHSHFGPKTCETKIFDWAAFRLLPKEGDDLSTSEQGDPKNRYTFLVRNCCKSWEEEGKDLVAMLNDGSSGGHPSQNTSTRDRARWEAVKKALVSQGLPEAAAASLVGKLQQEP
ncbi:unnamed protein product [Amoebophrya sp. A120]|nr:unnamed protein product [Amoebophrya sp. A120]|eukprot:GSA120T00010387001.1